MYFHGKDQFILLHGDIAIPLVLKGPEGFVYFEGGASKQPLDLTDEQLSTYQKTSPGSEYIFNGITIRINTDGSYTILETENSVTLDVSSLSFLSCSQCLQSLMVQLLLGL